MSPCKIGIELLKFKELEKEHKQVKEDLYNLFEEKGILSFDTGTMKITKVAPTSYETISIDTKKLKEENEEIYNKYKVTKTTNKKGYILITTKKEDKYFHNVIVFITIFSNTIALVAVLNVVTVTVIIAIFSVHSSLNKYIK